MSKKDQYRFSIKLDAEDEEHRMVASYLNRIGRKKSRVIVKAMTAWLNNDRNSKSCENKTYLAEEAKIREGNLEETVTAGTGLKIETNTNVRTDVNAGSNINGDTDVNDSERSGRLLSLDTDSYEIDMAEVALMRKNYNKLKKEG